jgi:hypothetical protein
MASYGFNFRNAAAYVTDPVGTTYSIGTAYPETRNGITFGWTVTNASRSDRSLSVDPRVAGINHLPSGSAPRIFRVQLPAPGVYDVGAAMGDAGSIQLVQYIEIYDNTTSLWIMQSAAGTGVVNRYYDLNGTLHTSDVNFFANQTLKRLTFASTTMFAHVGKVGVGTTHTIAHLSITEVTVAGPTLVRPIHGTF